MLSNQDILTEYSKTFFAKFMEYLPNIISALVLLLLGLWSIRILKNIVSKIMNKRNLEATLANFLGDLLNWTLKILLFITVISQLGVQTSSFVAILGAAGLAIGLSLQGSLANFAGGVLIIMFKPFRVGDFIQAQGEMGTVAQIQIFVTKLHTADNQIIYIPNGQLSNGTINNFSQSTHRRADLTISISYGSDIKKAKEIAMEVMQKHELVLDEPTPVVWVKDLADSSVDLAVRPWAKNENFWAMRSDILQQIKEAFDNNGIKIPYPQRDLHIKTTTL
jgi:small conductance mechanosensitive channel